MGDISELRGLVTVVSFLGVCLVLIMLIPPQFVTAQSGREVYVPDYFESIDIMAFAETKIIGMNETEGEVWYWNNQYYRVDVDIGDWDIDFYYRRPTMGLLNCFLMHVHYEWIIFPADHRLDWFDSNGLQVAGGMDELTVSDIEDNSQDGYTSKFRAVCPHTTYHVTFAYDSDTWGSFSEAWNNSGLQACFGVNFDQTNTSYNAWNIIGMLLFFQLPNVHWLINMVLNIPIWVCIAYLTYILILRAIGAIFGGGA